MLTHRSLKRQVVWDEMLRLEGMGLGQRQIVSMARDKFVLAMTHPAVTLLSSRPEANGFVRADEDTLLFRAPSNALRQRLADAKPGYDGHCHKGFQLRWNAIDITDIERMFAALRSSVDR